MGNCFGKKTDIHLEKQYLINMDPELQLATFKNTPKFLPNIPVSKVIKVYDGDTITIAGKLDNQEEIYKWNIRLNNIDTPELKGKNINENEKKIAQIAKKILHDRLMPGHDGFVPGYDTSGEIVQLKILKHDKYGRLLCDVFHNGQCINDWMIEKRLAVQYSGKTKTQVNWVKYYLTGEIL